MILRWLKRVGGNILVRSLYGARRGFAHLLIQRFKLRQWLTAILLKALSLANKCPASLISIFAVGGLLYFSPLGKFSSAGDFHLASGSILGGAMALVLSLSIIPAQKAAEAFSAAIFRLYAKDAALLAVFLVLTVGTLFSFYLGLDADGRTDHVGPVTLQFIILGTAFDALRYFYQRTLELLAPQTALALVQKECSKQIRRVSKATDEIVRIQRLMGAASDANNAPLRAIIFNRSNIAPTLRGWIAQLEEFAHKAIASRDTTTANLIVTALCEISREYTDARKNSLVLTPDFQGPIPVGVSDINTVLSKVHECIGSICEDAASQKNELVVQHCLTCLGQMVAKAMTVIHGSAEGHKTAPLAYAPTFHLKLCIETAMRASMQDACLAGLRALGVVISSTPAEIDAHDVIDTALDAYFVVAQGSYSIPQSVLAHPAVEGIMLAALRDIELRGYENLPVLDKALQFVEALVPLEAIMDANKLRMLQTFPPYNMGSATNLANVLQQVANKAGEKDISRPWINVLHDFCEASAKVSSHFRNLGSVNFSGALLLKWVMDTLFECAGVHIRILREPSATDEPYAIEVEEKLIWMLNALTFLLSSKNSVPAHQASEAAGSIAYIGMIFLEDGNFKVADECANIIAYIAKSAAESTNEPYKFADIVQYLEAMALAADVLGHTDTALRYRQFMRRPAVVPAEGAVEYLNAIVRRIEQFREGVERHSRSFRRRDPEEKLHGLLKGHELPEQDEEFTQLVAGWS